MMENFTVLIWAIGGGFAIVFGGMILGFKILREDMKILKDDLSKKIDKLDEKVTDIDRRLCRLEGAFSNKDCCMIKDHRMHEKAE